MPSSKKPRQGHCAPSKALPAVKVPPKGQRIGYIRVSTFDQNPDRQLEGVPVDRSFVDHASGKDVDRPQLAAMLGFVRDGDTVVVHSMDRLARNLDDLRRVVQGLTARGVCVEFIKEHLSFTGEDSPMAILMLSVMGAFAEFERSLIKERQREGIALARQRGVYRGRKKTLSAESTAELIRRVATGERKSVVARDLGISRETLYQYLRSAGIKTSGQGGGVAQDVIETLDEGEGRGASVPELEEKREVSAPAVSRSGRAKRRKIRGRG